MILLNKKQVRFEILRDRDNFLDYHSANSAIEERFQQFILPLIQPKDTIAAYYPSGSEIDILPILVKLSEQSFKILLPAMDNARQMTFYPWQPQDELIPTKHAKNILEPKKQEQPTLPSIIITPLIACDLNGNRIGSGKGIYDRYINNLTKKALCIGLCYDFQLLDKIPAEFHDQPLDLILTDKRFINKSKI